MAGMYPDNETISLFGEEISWPGIDPDTGKFTNGDFSNPLKRPSCIPAETINLILDNLAGLITGLGGEPDNSGADQLKNAVLSHINGRASTALPLMDGGASAGAAAQFARGDHRHPTDTSRAPLASPALTGAPTAPTAAANTFRPAFFSHSRFGIDRIASPRLFPFCSFTRPNRRMRKHGKILKSSFLQQSWQTISCILFMEVLNETHYCMVHRNGRTD